MTAALLSVNAGIRQVDILRLSRSAYIGEILDFVLPKTRNKKYNRVRVSVTDDLRTILDAIPRRGIQIVLSEEAGRPFLEDNFRKVFAKIRNECS